MNDDRVSLRETVRPPGWSRVLGGVWRLSWPTWIAWRRFPGVLAVLLGSPLLAFLSLPADGTNALLDWAMNLHLQLIVPLYCLVVCGAMIRDELQAETLGFLITRPVTRVRLLLAKYVSHLGWLQGVLLVNAGLLLLAGAARGIPEAATLAGPLLGVQVLAVVVYSALGTFLGLVTKRYLVLGVVYGFLIEIGIGHIPTNINSLSMLRHVRTLLAQSPLVQQRYDWSALDPWFSAVLMLGGTLVFLAASAALFTFREYLSTDEAPK